MENKDKVMTFRDAAIEVIEEHNENAGPASSNSTLIYNAGFNAGVFAMLHQLEEKLGQIKELQDILGDLRKSASGPYDGIDPDIEDYLGGND